MNTSHRITGKRARQAGATLVEFALVMPIALLLVLGIIQLGLMFSAKQIVNQAAFVAARAGSTANAREDVMMEALTTALIPFYQDTTERNDFVRLRKARFEASREASCMGAACFVRVEMLNPTPAAFADFGVRDNSAGGARFIPNDNLEHRSRGVGGSSGMTLHDANALKIKVTYAYDLKVPLMKSVIGSVMCGVDLGIDAFDRDKSVPLPGDVPANDCANFYSKGRILIVSYATVQMQTPAMSGPGG